MKKYATAYVLTYLLAMALMVLLVSQCKGQESYFNQYRIDTVECVLLVTDTSTHTSESVKGKTEKYMCIWQGSGDTTWGDMTTYEKVSKRVPTNDNSYFILGYKVFKYYTSPRIITGYELPDIVYYLDDRKKLLDKNIIVWLSKEIQP